MILVSGSLAYDYIMDFPGYFREHILPEKLHVLSVSFLIDKMERNFGGTAGNIAYNLALLGERPTILASAGSDFEDYEKWLKLCRSVRIYPRSSDAKASHYAVDVSRIQRVENTPTASCYITTDQADNQIAAFYPGAMGTKCKIQNANLKIKIKNAKLAIVSPGNIEDMKVLPRLYKKYGVPYVYDPGQNIPTLTSTDLRAGISGAKVFISNDYELTMVLKKTGWKKKEVLKRVKVLVTTLGEKGSVIECRMQNAECRMWRIPAARPKNVSDPTGAGDAYRAGFIKGLLMGLPYDKVGKLASTVAVYTVEKYGTQTHRFTWSQILQRYKVNYGEHLTLQGE